MVDKCTLQDVTHLFSNIFQWSHVYATTVGIQRQHPQDGHLPDDGLSASGWSPDEYVVISIIHCIKHCEESKEKLQMRVASRNLPVVSGLHLSLHEEEIETGYTGRAPSLDTRLSLTSV